MSFLGRLHFTGERGGEGKSSSTQPDADGCRIRTNEGSVPSAFLGRCSSHLLNTSNTSRCCISNKLKRETWFESIDQIASCQNPDFFKSGIFILPRDFLCVLLVLDQLSFDFPISFPLFFVQLLCKCEISTQVHFTPAPGGLTDGSTTGHTQNETGSMVGFELATNGIQFYIVCNKSYLFASSSII